MKKVFTSLSRLDYEIRILAYFSFGSILILVTLKNIFTLLIGEDKPYYIDVLFSYNDVLLNILYSIFAGCIFYYFSTHLQNEKRIKAATTGLKFHFNNVRNNINNFGIGHDTSKLLGLENQEVILKIKNSLKEQLKEGEPINKYKTYWVDSIETSLGFILQFAHMLDNETVQELLEISREMVVLREKLNSVERNREDNFYYENICCVIATSMNKVRIIYLSIEKKFKKWENYK